MTPPCMPSRKSRITGDHVAAVSTIAFAGWGVWYAATPLIVSLLKWGLVGLVVVGVLIGVFIAARRWWRKRPKVESSQDWIDDLSNEPVTMRGQGAAELMTIFYPAQAGRASRKNRLICL